MDLDLKNKIIVITGATGGIGGQIAIDFLKEDAIVVCLVRNPAKMDLLKKDAKDQNVLTENLHDYKCDLLDYNNMKEVIKQILIDFKTIDILVNCAGHAIEYPLGLMDENQIESMLDLNLKSPIFLSHLVLRPMFKQKSGNIINISSASTVKKGRGIVVYASAKAGLETFTRTLAQEVGRKNIRVNCIRPGIIKTKMSNAVIYRLEETIKENCSLGRVGTVHEIAKAVLFVASEKTASYMTGECITIDGGIY